MSRTVAASSGVSSCGDPVALKEGNLCSSSSDSGSDSDPRPEYYFESDPLVLKNNSDYQQLLRCQVKLQAQRASAVKNLEHLLELWDYGIKNPMKFVDDFSNGRLNLPDKLNIEELPPIDWTKYNLTSLKGDLRRNTRKRVAAARAANTAAAAQSSSSSSSTGRGRGPPATKPHSFNQSWTAEEQKRLDELLIIFPPEDIAVNRYRKIAEELGTRSSIQVQSRVQKYSIALKKNKICLPGYKPPSRNVMRKPTGSYRRRTNALPCPRSIFLAPHDLDPTEGQQEWAQGGGAIPKLEDCPVKYNTDGGDLKRLKQGPQADYSGAAAGVCRQMPPPGVEDIQLTALRRLKGYKAKEQQQQRGLHYTYTCCVCQVSPIEGVRYHCRDCVVSSSTATSDVCSPSVDYCRRCHMHRIAVPPATGAAGATHHNASHKVEEFYWMHIKKTLSRITQLIKYNR